MRDCITMCFDICTINIRVSIRVRGLHLVFPYIGNVIIPLTFIFFRGVGQPPTRSWWTVSDYQMVGQLRGYFSAPSVQGLALGQDQVTWWQGGRGNLPPWAPPGEGHQLWLFASSTVLVSIGLRKSGTIRTHGCKMVQFAFVGLLEKQC